MIRIKFPEQLPSKIEAWKVKAQSITDEIIAETRLKKRHELIDQYKNHWRETDLINWLSDLGHKKCWYTETKFGGDYQELEHFRPKKGTKTKDGKDHPTHTGYNWLAFDLNNYRLSKSRPNRKKGTLFPIKNERYRANDETESWEDELPLFLDPLDEEDYLLLSFDDTGKPVPEEDLDGDDIERVEFTIEKYFLDERILNSGRKDVWDTCRKLYNRYLNGMKASKATGSSAKRESAKADLAQLKNLLKEEQQFSSVARSSLLKLGERMAIKIASSSI